MNPFENPYVDISDLNPIKLVIMKTFNLFKKKNQLSLLLGVFSLIALSSCSKDNDGSSQDTYSTQVSITDAPIDNANVSGAFVTITDVRVDGQSVEGFNATTLDVSALQNGNTTILGNIDLESRTYSNVSLVLDYANDVDGNSPGCYILTADDVKHALVSSSEEININDSFEVVQGISNQLVIDFDLRKSIIASEGSSSDQFDFVTNAELKNSLRLVNRLKTGTISGTATDSQNTSEKIVVYAYERGSFNAETEANGQGSSNVRFANAVTSTVVNSTNGSYQLSFLEEGEYELHFASYNDEDDDGKLEFTSMLSAESVASLNLLNLQVDANVELTANILITGSL